MIDILLPITVDCQWTTWECSECSKTCVGGYKNCNRTIITEAKHDGVPCSGTDSGKSETCLGVECPGITHICPQLKNILFILRI